MIASLALFAAATAPQSANDHELFSREDYPERAVNRGEEGSTYVQILINPAGQVDTCTIIQSSGYADLDQQTCAIIQTRARFIPGKGNDGRGVFSLYRVPVTWALNQAPLVTVNPDFDLTVNHGPTGVRLPLELKVTYFITTTGTVTKCGDSDAGSPQELVDLACKVISATPYDIVRDHTGTPVTAMDCVKVRFRVKH